MVKIIETNIYNIDFQSRVIEYSSWEDYCKLYEEYNGVRMGDVTGTLYGCIFPNSGKILSKSCDDIHLQCDLELFNKTKIKKLAYLITN